MEKKVEHDGYRGRPEDGRLIERGRRVKAVSFGVVGGGERDCWREGEREREERGGYTEEIMKRDSAKTKGPTSSQKR
jgi:hypothetical protein